MPITVHHSHVLTLPMHRRIRVKFCTFRVAEDFKHLRLTHSRVMELLFKVHSQVADKSKVNPICINLFKDRESLG